MHETDAKLIAAYHVIKGLNLKVTDPRLSEHSGISVRTSKKRRQAMVRKGTWPGEVANGPTPKHIVDFIRAEAAKSPKPTIRMIAKQMKEQFNYTMHDKTIERISKAPDADWLRNIQERVREQIKLEYMSRHLPDRQYGKPVYQLIRA